MDLETFAAERDVVLRDLVQLYQPAVTEALEDDSETSRTETLLVALAAAFILMYGEEGGDEGFARSASAPFLASMRSALELLVPDRSSDSAKQAQNDRLTNWFATATLGAATLAAAQDSASGGIEATKTWVTMRDEDVRDIHAQLDGETKSATETFTVKSDPPAMMLYPGQPVGPPEAWINCRCVLKIDASPIVAAAEGGGFSGVVLVALPDGDRTVTYADGDTTELHQTIAYLGDVDQLQPGEGEAIIALAEAMAAQMSPFTARVAGMGTLGKDQDSIAITEAAELQGMHDMVLSDEVVGAMFAERNNHPTWISHVTGDGFAVGDEIRFDRVAAWFGGENHQAFEMTGAAVEDEEVVDETPVADVPEDGEPPIPDELIAAEDENMPVYGIAVPEGIESGDKRMFKIGSITHRDLPLPLTWQRAAAQEHEGEVVVGRIDTLENRNGMWHYTAEILTDVPESEEVINLIAQGALRGVSIAADKGVVEDPTDEEIMAAMESGVMPPSVWAEARISGLTIVQIPAFQESFISLGLEPAAEEQVAAAGGVDTYKRGSGWITHPEETNRLHTYWTRGPGAAKIAWGTNGDFTRCTRQLRKYIEPRFLNRTCAQWHHDALGYWPGELGKPGNNPKNSVNCDTPECEDTAMIAASADFPSMAPSLTLTAAAPPSLPKRSLFDDPKLSGPTALTIRDRVLFGHIATWDVCHIGIDKQCVTAPKSRSNYAHFHLGAIQTDEGELAVGSLTMGTGHADLKLAAASTTAHYDNTGTMVASVRAGEDQFGIWVAGVVCDGVTDDQVRTLAAAGGISGDWRSIGGNLELVAALAVNVPGFPVPRPALAASAERQTALVAAGFVRQDKPVTVDAVAAAVVAQLERRDARRSTFDRLADVKAEARAKRISALQDV